MNDFELLLFQVLELLIFSEVFLLLDAFVSLNFLLYLLGNYWLLLFNLLLVFALLLFLLCFLQVCLIHYCLFNLRKIVIDELLIPNIEFVCLFLFVN